MRARSLAAMVWPAVFSSAATISAMRVVFQTKTAFESTLNALTCLEGRPLLRVRLARRYGARRGRVALGGLDERAELRPDQRVRGRNQLRDDRMLGLEVRGSSRKAL
jgi:hypothetical protein